MFELKIFNLGVLEVVRDDKCEEKCIRWAKWTSMLKINLENSAGRSKNHQSSSDSQVS